MAPRKLKGAKPAVKSAPTKSSAKKPKKRAAPEPQPVLSEKYAMPYTSLASRKRLEPKCSIASLRELETEDVIEEKFVGYFGEKSDNHYTWGKTEANPIMAIKRNGRKRVRLRSFANGFSSIPDFDESPELSIPNSPDRSHLLRVSLEIRERIYSFLLTYKRPIILQYDWRAVEHKIYRSVTIFRVCKQISEEAIPFLYKNNAFRAVIRPPPSEFFYRQKFSIDARFVPLFRNAIIQCELKYFTTEWYEKACESVKLLCDANVVLDALTLVTFPQQLCASETAVGFEKRPISFADFFHHSGGFITELKKLNCKVFNIVVKKTHQITNEQGEDEDETYRLLMSLDLRYSHAAEQEEGVLVNEDTVLLGRAQAEAVETELLGLKRRFEEVFEDDELAERQGKCRLLDQEETYENGLALARGTCRGFS